MSITRVKQAGLFGQNLSIEQQMVLDCLLEYSEVSEKEFYDTALARRPVFPIIESLCSFGHQIYMKVQVDKNGEEIEGSRKFYMDDCSHITERRLKMSGSITPFDPKIDYVA